MDPKAFVEELSASNKKLLNEIGELNALAAPVDAETKLEQKNSLTGLLRIALANEISVAELASMWMPTVTDWEFKIALASQAGDEARHFRLVEQRLKELGISIENFKPPPVNPLFEYLRNLKTPVEKIAAGQFTLESIAYRVNENFLHYCDLLGDHQTAELYRKYIQPDELHHHQMGQQLLEKYAKSEEEQICARLAATKTLEIARDLRTAAARKIGTSCFPGC